MTPPLSLDFVLFAITLLGVAIFHHRTLQVAVSGLALIIGYKVLASPFGEGPGLTGLIAHLGHEWVVVANLACLLLGFAVLARHFEKSHVPLTLPHLLADDWKGAFTLLVIVFAMSAFLDNIAAVLIGGAVARTLFERVHIGYLAALVTAANAGGAGSVVGDTTTTMMWIAGVSPVAVLPAFAAALVALLVIAYPASRQQQAHSPIRKDTRHKPHIDWARVAIVVAMLTAAVATNVVVNVWFPAHAEAFPFLGVAVWTVVFATAGIRRPDWEHLQAAGRGAVFLLSLVLAASMMPVDQLPDASSLTTFAIGAISSVFDNIPLTKLALDQGGYDWALLAYAVGVGGSMTWFGSSAGVALLSEFPDARSVTRWTRGGWFVPIAYVAGFAVMLAAFGWQPTSIAAP
ncbi:MAG: SLC13 family permease [Acidobacteriota bacterium]